MDHEKMAREICDKYAHPGAGLVITNPPSILDKIRADVARALERAALEARINQAEQDGQLALRIHDEVLTKGGVRWRVGTKVALNVYAGDRPICQCHNEEDARNIAAAMNQQDEGVHCPDEVTRRITHEVIPALRRASRGSRSWNLVDNDEGN